MQRERERERERFETDRGRDHGRRTIERSQSPSHIATRRPMSPTTSPLSERILSDSDRRIRCRSSDRSGSCSSISPPRFEKPEKTRSERYNKCEKPEKDRLFEVERGNLVDKEKRASCKDRGEKDKSEKQKLKKLKIASPIIQSCETEPEVEREDSPEPGLRSKNSKITKESSGKGRLDLLPCVVQLTRVKEKEGKLIGHAFQEKQNQRGGSNSPRLGSPSSDQRSPPYRSELSKVELSKHGKAPRDKNMHSLVEVIDKDAKIKSKKLGKLEMGADIISLDIDRLAARKRRFEDSGKTERQKRNSEDDPGRSVHHKLWNNFKEQDLEKNLARKGMHKKEHHKDKCMRLVIVNSPKDGQDSETNSLGLSVDGQSHISEFSEESTEQLDSAHPKMALLCSKTENSSSLTKTPDAGSVDLDELREQHKRGVFENEQVRLKSRDSEDGDEHFGHIDQTNICKTQIEQRQWNRPKLREPDKLVKYENPPSIETIDFEKEYVIHDFGKPNHDLGNDDYSFCKRKKLESFDFEVMSAKRERKVSSSQKLNEVHYHSKTSSISTGQLPANEQDETSSISVALIKKERKLSPTTDDKLLHTDVIKNSSGLTPKRYQSSENELPKLKASLHGCDDEFMHRWERRTKSDSLRMEMSFPSDIPKRESIHRNIGQDLEPGEVQSDSDDDIENKHISPKSNSSLSFILRERDERMTDLKLSGSLEKNKFYSFALDKTITPDTKSLLERAKTLYSSREDNWSFLPSRFPASHSCSDKDKVELAPRPIPPWYLKRKKIRTESGENLHDKKEELKPQDQERQELFASRFLHSSIFEQDSRRLQRLERKDQDLEKGTDRALCKPGSTESQPKSGGGDVTQEPIVLFHSRFMELQQQKDKEHIAPDNDSYSAASESKKDPVQNCDSESSDKESSIVLKVEIKSGSPSSTSSVSPIVSFSTEISQEQTEVVSPATDPPVLIIKEEKEEPNLNVSPPPSLPIEDGKTLVPHLAVTSPIVSELENEKIPKLELSEPQANINDSLTVEHTPEEEKPPTPGSSLSEFEKESTEFTFSHYQKAEEKSSIEAEPKTESQETKDSEELGKNETESEVCMPELEAETKPVPNRRQAKSKRAKPLSVLRSSQPAQNVTPEKPATRKSERIDREKLKRASSPRAEALKSSLESKATSKSPSHVSDSEQNLDSSLIHGRTRRRNVRSVYATLHEDDQTGKEVVESSRSMRKRGTDKEPLQQDAPVATTGARRGRPPKRTIKRSEELSPLKVEMQKVMEDDTEVKENSSTMEVVKASEGWRSPRSQKAQQTHLTSSASANKKGSRIDKQSGSTPVLADQPDVTSQDESELKSKAEPETFAKLPEETNNTSLLVHTKDKDLKDSSGKESNDIEKIDSSSSERKQPEKGVKMKPSRFKRNTKQIAEDKSHSLKNLEIRVSVDDVKGLLRVEDGEQESFAVPPITKTKTAVQENDKSKVISLPLESKQQETDENAGNLLQPEPPVDPVASLLAQQMELEQAVENIAKLTVEQPSRPYKEPPTGQTAALPPAVVEEEGEVEAEKRANPASETELAAAIDSITAEDLCGDTDGFTAAPTYTAIIPTPESLISNSSSEIMEPETHMVINNILAADSDDGPLTPSPKAPTSDVKTADEPSHLETPKKTGKVRAKTPKKTRGRKSAANKKEDITGEISQTEPSPVKLPESIPEDRETINSKAVTVTAGESVAASVVTAVATCRRDVTSAITVDTPKEAEQPEVEQPVPKESAFHSGPTNISSSKKHLQAAQPSKPTISATRPQAISQFSVPFIRPAKLQHSSDWPQRSEESRIYVAPSCHVTVVTPTVPTPTTLSGTVSGNPPMPPDTKASDIDTSSSTLRKILMEPKYVSASNSNSIPTTMVTSVLLEPRMSENDRLDIMNSRQLHSEERPQFPLQSTHHKPSPLTESQQNCGEKTQHTVISPATSVISRIPMPYDTETPRISLSNRNVGLSIPKQKFRSNSNENHRYHGLDIVEDGTIGRSVVETIPYNTVSSPSLRMNTPEGVVVLSYSGQKTEGPHRMRAKISQIPQASAGDIEFQQSVSKSQLKQEPHVTSSQSPSQKVTPISSTYGHTGVLLTGQSFNTQPVISCTKQDSRGSEKSEAPYHTASQGGVVKMFQQPVSSPPVLMYNQAVIQQQHVKRGLGTEPLSKKMDMGKAVQQPNRSPVMSPHHQTLSGSRMSPSPGVPSDRSAIHHKQEAQSPRTAVHSPSHFAKVCPPSGSPIGTGVVLGHGMPPISTYHSSMHHPHSEQSSVIIQPHSLTQSVSHDARMNTAPVSGINYGRRGDALTSTHSGPSQRSNTSQPNVIRDMVLQSHSSPQRSLSGVGSSEEDPRHLNQTLSRTSVPQLQSDVMMISNDHRGLHSSIRMDQYRDMHQHILMHQQLGEQATAESRQSRNSEAVTSISLSGPTKSSIVTKSIEHTKESVKPLEGKPIHPPTNESRIRGVHASSPVLVSPHPHGVQLMHPGSSGSFSVYRDMRGFPSQYPGHTSSGHCVANQGITSSQVT